MNMKKNTYFACLRGFALGLTCLMAVPLASAATVIHNKVAYDAWPKEITPSAELRKLYHAGELPFEGFAATYLDELEASAPAHAFAQECRRWLEEDNVTLLYAAKNQQENHAQVLAAWLRQKSGAEGGA